MRRKNGSPSLCVHRNPLECFPGAEPLTPLGALPPDPCQELCPCTLLGALPPGPCQRGTAPLESYRGPWGRLLFIGGANPCWVVRGLDLFCFLKGRDGGRHGNWGACGWRWLIFVGSTGPRGTPGAGKRSKNKTRACLKNRKRRLFTQKQPSPASKILVIRKYSLRFSP